MKRFVGWIAVLIVFSALIARHTTHASAQEPKKEDKKDEPAVKLRWYGQSFFQLETARGFKIVFDPHAIPNFGRPRVEADYVLVSHLHNDHNQIEVLDRKPKKDEKAKGDVDVYYGVVETKPGKQDWKAVD